MHHKLLRVSGIALLWLILLPPALAGGSKDVGEYVIHYNALHTDKIAPNVASAYGILRSRTRGMLNVAVARKTGDGTTEPVTAKVDVHAANLTGQVKQISLREIREDEAIYYIGEVNVADGETLVFDLYVTPQGSEETHHIRFQQSFFAE